ncbi:SDR family NAD(P)-dependent oxidoreductase [Saccharibacillus sp. CPCC 101409]|uniref:SDR family NAD(P)-dependent oxidoreductase n=1 Tax=Saccharibacillus sp. CPCC 101409 TaxID=3058041 RepID=UPI002670E59C|nr:SDR family NAD(P)-dependent oxidoreductase [Saccharibacillus sp. CPCC 101409]MDO3411104.1 SDR family NAD(P)-dependent oxidoreductase [Saccharibacillus sp. CPCC 101409]
MIKHNAVVTGADRGLGLALAEGLLVRGWRVFAGSYLPDWPQLKQLEERYPGMLVRLPLDVSSDTSVLAAAAAVEERTRSIDLLINNAGVITDKSEDSIRAPQDYEDILRVYQVNSLGPVRMTEAFLPLLERGEQKRICYVSSEAGSIGKAERTAWFAYCMSKAALNMGIKSLFSRLRPDGYTFRVYHPGWMKTYMSGEKNEQAELEPAESAAPALDYFLGAALPWDEKPRAVDEDRLVMRDWQGREWPW